MRPVLYVWKTMRMEKNWECSLVPMVTTTVYLFAFHLLEQINIIIGTKCNTVYEKYLYLRNPWISWYISTYWFKGMVSIYWKWFQLTTVNALIHGWPRGRRHALCVRGRWSPGLIQTRTQSLQMKKDPAPVNALHSWLETITELGDLLLTILVK